MGSVRENCNSLSDRMMTQNIDSTATRPENQKKNAVRPLKSRPFSASFIGNPPFSPHCQLISFFIAFTSIEILPHYKGICCACPILLPSRLCRAGPLLFFIESYDSYQELIANLTCSKGVMNDRLLQKILRRIHENFKDSSCRARLFVFQFCG